MELLEWQKRTAPFTLALSLAYTFAFVYPIYWYPVSHTTKNVCEIFAYVIWGLFALDYLIQMKLAPDNKKYFKAHLFALLLVAVPFFRPLRALRAWPDDRCSNGRLCQQPTECNICRSMTDGIAESFVAFDLRALCIEEFLRTTFKATL